RAGRDRRRADAVRRHAADDVLRHRGDDERAAPRARRHRARDDPQVRRRLPRPRRRAAGPGGLRAGHAGHPGVVGRARVVGDVYQAGTMSGNPLAVAAGRAALELLDEEAYLTLSSTTAALADGLVDAAGDRPVCVVHTTGLLTLFFAEQPPDDYAGAAACDTE